MAEAEAGDKAGPIPVKKVPTDGPEGDGAPI